ncbi:MAG: type II toxin-antitoxin system VapC family toxin [Candidatus Eremiobacterota bacterium]
MSGELAVDTNAVIAYRKGSEEVCAIIDRVEILFVPAIVLGELLYGAINSKEAEENKKAIYDFLENSVLLPIDEAICSRYSTLRFCLKQAGNPIPENDIWIAGICLEDNLTLLTRDKHFEKIPGLKVLTWKE